MTPAVGAAPATTWQGQEPERFGLMSGYVWRTDPKRLLFVLARYKFVAKMLAGRGRVLEVGCADAFGTRLVAQEVDYVVGIDIDPAMLGSAAVARWPIGLVHHDILAAPIRAAKGFDAAYAIDVLEHIPAELEDRFMTHISASLSERAGGVVILGTPSLESQAYASEISRAGHVNCKTQAELRALCARHFSTVLLFGMNDEMVHTGFGPLCHYLWAVCSGPRQ